MKIFMREIVCGRNAVASAFFVLGVFLFVGLGCSGSGKSGETKPTPPAYLGDWKAQDGSTISIRADGKGDYKSGGTSVDGGTVEVNEAEKKLSITFFGIGPSFKIDSPPSGDEMKLDGMIYRRNGGFTTTAPDTKKDVADKPDAPDSTSGDTSGKADASKDEIPKGDELQEMVQKTLIDFNDAVQADDFTDFFPTISKLWQKESSPAKLKETFQGFIDQKVDFGEIRTMGANFTTKPRIDNSKGFKELIVEGNYDTKPTPTRFNLKYTPEGKSWKLTGISVDNRR